MDPGLKSVYSSLNLLLERREALATTGIYGAPLPFLPSAGFWGEDGGHNLYSPSLLETDVLW